MQHQKRITATRAAKAGIMNNSKWVKILGFINKYIGNGNVSAKMLDGETLCQILPETYSDELRVYCADGLAGPLKLLEIKYIAVPLPD